MKFKLPQNIGDVNFTTTYDKHEEEGDGEVSFQFISDDQYKYDDGVLIDENEMKEEGEVGGEGKYSIGSSSSNNNKSNNAESSEFKYVSSMPVSSNESWSERVNSFKSLPKFVMSRPQPTSQQQQMLNQENNNYNNMVPFEEENESQLVETIDTFIGDNIDYQRNNNTPGLNDVSMLETAIAPGEEEGDDPIQEEEENDGEGKELEKEVLLNKEEEQQQEEQQQNDKGEEAEQQLEGIKKVAAAVTTSSNTSEDDATTSTSQLEEDDEEEIVTLERQADGDLEDKSPEEEEEGSTHNLDDTKEEGVEEEEDDEEEATREENDTKSSTTEGQGVEINETNEKTNWGGFDEDSMSSPQNNVDYEQEVQSMSVKGHDISEAQNKNDYEGDGFGAATKYHLLRGKGKVGKSSYYPRHSTIGSSAMVAVLVVILCGCLCYIRHRRRRNEQTKRPYRGNYAAIGRHDFFNGTFSDDVSYGKDSDDDDNSIESFGSDDGGGGGHHTTNLEMGGFHELDANGGLTLEEVNG
jgi:hypothetical protein